MNILILDDEDAIIRSVEETIRNNYPECAVYSAHNGAEFNEIIGRSNPIMDMIFADISLGEENGIMLAAAAKSRNPEVQIVFVSGNPEMSRQAIEIGGNVNFIKKPVDEFYIRFHIDSFLSHSRRNEDVFSYVSGQNKFTVSLSKIMFFESSKNNVFIHLIDETRSVRAKLSDYEEKLSNKFVRCHQSFIVNISYVAELRQDCLELSGGETVPVSKAHLKETRDKFFSFKGGLL